MRNFVVLKRTDKTKKLRHFFGSVDTSSGEADFYCTFCQHSPKRTGKFSDYEKILDDEATKPCPRGINDYIVLKSLNGLEKALNCGYELVTVIQDPIETDEY